jgi:hypothetical protein
VSSRIQRGPASEETGTSVQKGDESLDSQDIIPAHRGWYAIVPSSAASDPRLSKGAIRTLIALGAHANPSRWAWPRQSLLREELGLAPNQRRSLRNWIAELELLGYVRTWPYFNPTTNLRGSTWYLVAPFPDGVTMPPTERRKGATDGASITPTDGAIEPPTDGVTIAPGDGASMPPTRTEHLNGEVNSPSNVHLTAPLRGEVEVSNGEIHHVLTRSLPKRIDTETPEQKRAKARAASKEERDRLEREGVSFDERGFPTPRLQKIIDQQTAEAVARA